jgi:hypothetical protein
MRKSSPEEQAAWRLECQQYGEDGPVCDNCGESVRAEEIPDLPILCVSCGMARERQVEQDDHPPDEPAALPPGWVWAASPEEIANEAYRAAAEAADDGPPF